MIYIEREFDERSVDLKLVSRPYIRKVVYGCRQSPSFDGPSKRVLNVRFVESESKDC